MLKDGPKIYRLARFQLRRVLRYFKYIYSAPCLAWQWNPAIRTQSRPRTPILFKSKFMFELPDQKRRVLSFILVRDFQRNKINV